MYKKDSTETITTSAKPGGVVLLPPAGAIPADALVASCDGCGAQVWLDPSLKATLDQHQQTNRTFCPNCLKTRKVAP